MKHYKLKLGKGELNSTSGNHLCGLLLGKLPKTTLPKNLLKRRARAIADRDILLSQIGLLCNGRNNFSDIDLYRGDELFMNAYGLKAVASESAFRQRFDDLPSDKTHEALRKLNIRLLAQREFGRVDADDLKLVPVDMDVSPFDNSGSAKEGVSFTYKKHDGFAPMFTYIGAEGYMLDCELRPGKQHCQSGTPEAIARATDMIEKLGLNGQCLYRLDSGNDAKDNVEHFGENFFIVKRNLRREVPEQWLSLARRVGEKQPSRDGKNIYTGFVDHFHPGGETQPSVPVAYKVVERLPSGKLCVNKIILLCAMNAFNLLRTLGQEVIKRKELAPQRITVKRWRLKTVLQNMIYCAVRIVRHAGAIELHFGKRCPWFDVIRDIAATHA